MHRSRLAGFIIDCNTDDLEGAARFWSAALGYDIQSDPADPKYRTLDTEQLGLHVEVQAVDHPSRVHLDIEADDIEAEAQRLETLGAKRIAQVNTWIVMEAPTGQRFCVVRPQGNRFAAEARTWK